MNQTCIPVQKVAKIDLKVAKIDKPNLCFMSKCSLVVKEKAVIIWSPRS